MNRFSLLFKALARRFPDLLDEIRSLQQRLVDLLPIVRNYYYHPSMHGSFSIKKLLPIAAPQLSYSALKNVHDGTEAQLAFYEAIDSNTSADRKAELERSMLEYCKLDTLAMVEVVGYLGSV